MDLRCGRWQDALADVECGALIVDAPYSDRTHKGHDAAAVGADRNALAYASMSPAEVWAFVESWAPRCSGWIVSLTDHVLAPTWEAAMAAQNRVTFQPVPVVMPGMTVRLQGDGPSSWAVYAIVSRPRSKRFIGGWTTPGAYVVPSGHHDMHRTGGGAPIVRGAKPLWLMRALVRDYSRPGDLVCDPAAGGATTLLAAAIEGRRAVGSEMDPETHAKALARLTRGYTPTMFPASASKPAVTGSLFAEVPRLPA